jgi:hypothetical protein
LPVHPAPEFNMKRLMVCFLVSGLLMPFVASGCGSSSVNAAAKWDGKEPLPAPPPSKRKADQGKPIMKRVRGFTVPGAKS